MRGAEAQAEVLFARRVFGEVCGSGPHPSLRCAITSAVMREAHRWQHYTDRDTEFRLDSYVYARMHSRTSAGEKRTCEENMHREAQFASVAIGARGAHTRFKVQGGHQCRRGESGNGESSVGM